MLKLKYKYFRWLLRKNKKIEKCVIGWYYKCVINMKLIERYFYMLKLTKVVGMPNIKVIIDV